MRTQNGLGSDEMLIQRLTREIQQLRAENAELNRTIERKDEALLQLKVIFAMGRNNIEAAEMVFADLRPEPPLADAV